MTVQTTAREHQRLLEVAREYRQRGYEVIIEPRSDQLPQFLASFRIDMLARGAEENVIVEVRTQESLSDAPELDAVAQALYDKPSWRFELVVTNPKVLNVADQLMQRYLSS
jgi:REase_AHJR-like